MRPIRASEISSFLFCKRAWWYHQKGIEPGNLTELAEGTRLHHRHSRAVVYGGLLKILAYGFLLISLVLFVIVLTNLLL